MAAAPPQPDRAPGRAREVERSGLQLQLRRAQAEAGDVVLLYGDEGEALTPGAFAARNPTLPRPCLGRTRRRYSGASAGAGAQGRHSGRAGRDYPFGLGPHLAHRTQQRLYRFARTARPRLRTRSGSNTQARRACARPWPHPHQQGDHQGPGSRWIGCPATPRNSTPSGANLTFGAHA